MPNSSKSPKELNKEEKSLLLTLEHGSYEECGLAMGELLSITSHQDTLSPHADTIFENLCNIASQQISDENKFVTLSGITEILGNTDLGRLGFGFRTKRESFKGKSYPYQANIDDLLVGTRIRSALKRASYSFRKLFLSDNPCLKSYSAFLLSQCGSATSDDALSISRCINDTGDPITKSSLAIASAYICQLNRFKNETIDEIFTRLSEHSETICSIGGTLARLISKKDNVSERSIISHLPNALSHPWISVEYFPWSTGFVSGVSAQAISLSHLDDDIVTDLLLGGLEHWTKSIRVHSDATNIIEIAEHILRRFFWQNFAKTEYLEKTELTETQISVLKRAKKHIKQIGTSADSYGFLELEKNIDLYISSKRTAIDKPIKAYYWCGGQVVSWPLWKWWNQANLYDEYQRKEEEGSAVDYTRKILNRELDIQTINDVLKEPKEKRYGVPQEFLESLLASKKSGSETK